MMMTCLALMKFFMISAISIKCANESTLIPCESWEENARHYQQHYAGKEDDLARTKDYDMALKENLGSTLRSV